MIPTTFVCFIFRRLFNTGYFISDIQLAPSDVRRHVWTCCRRKCFPIFTSTLLIKLTNYFIYRRNSDANFSSIATTEYFSSESANEITLFDTNAYVFEMLQPLQIVLIIRIHVLSYYFTLEARCLMAMKMNSQIRTPIASVQMQQQRLTVIKAFVFQWYQALKPETSDERGRVTVTEDRKKQVTLRLKRTLEIPLFEHCILKSPTSISVGPEKMGI